MKNRIKTIYKIKHDILPDHPDDEFINDCPAFQEIPTFLPPVPRIIAMGDVHGDYDLAIKFFKIAKLIDDKLNWIASPLNTIVVQVGDQIDSCRFQRGYDCNKEKKFDDLHSDINVLQFFEDMHKKASKYGGAVYSLIGNHELMNAQGIFNYVSYDNYVNFKYISPQSINI